MHMDDTVIIASSRMNAEIKLQLLLTASHNLNMIAHPTKSKFLSFNTNNDKHPFQFDNVIIRFCEDYTYLGSFFSNK